MKLKTLVSALVAVCAMSFMAVTAQAADAYKLGTAVNLDGDVITSATEGEDVAVPIYLDSTQTSSIAQYTVDIEYDNTKFTAYEDSAEAVNDELYTIGKKNNKSYYGSLTYNGALSDSSVRLVWVKTGNSAPAIEDGGLLVAYVYFAPTADIANLDINDYFALKPIEFCYDSEDGTGAVRVTSFATYVTFEIPEDYTEAGYIHEVHLVLDDKDYKLENCVKTETGYKFITSINNTSDTKKSVKAKVVLKTAKTEDATEFDTVDFTDLGTISVEKF